MWTKGDNAIFTFGLALIVGVICFLFMMPAKADTTRRITATDTISFTICSTLMTPDFPGSSAVTTRISANADALEW